MVTMVIYVIMIPLMGLWIIGNYQSNPLSFFVQKNGGFHQWGYSHSWMVVENPMVEMDDEMG